MGEVFLKTLNMSIAASWLILAVVLLRFILKKAPKWVAVLLWGIVALRLAVPFSFESALSLIPSAETFNTNNIQYETPAISSGIPAVNNAVNPVLGETFAPNPVGSVNPLYVWILVVSVIWLIGIAAMLLYAVISYVRVHRSVAERVPYEGNIFLCDHVKSPFILGLVRPKIYLPSNMDAMAMEPVIAHEKAHLARRDHWWKPLGFLILTVHWFNPLCWIAYVLLCRDIELACDEKVIRQMDLDGKKQYSTALLECSTGRRLVTICPLAFGEVGVKERVKNVLNYKKPAFWVIVAAVIACAVVTVCFATNPKQDIPQEQRTVQVRITEVEDRSFLVAPVEGSRELSSSDLFRVSITNMPPSPEPQVGDIVEITYDGVILESYPAQFGTVYSMRVVSQENPPEIEELRVKYPEYFELGTPKGLEVYVWQMAENDYRFGPMQGTNREKTPKEKMALKGATAEEMALILSTFDIEDKSIFVIPWQNPISSYMVTENMVKDPEYINNIRSMLGLDGASMGSTGGADTPIAVDPAVAATTLSEEQTAIRQAIMEHNKSSNSRSYDVACCSFVTLETISGTPLAGSSTHKITYYGWALYETYKVTDGSLETGSGSHIPVALSFDLDERGYTLTEYWEPRDGIYYGQDIREKFLPYVSKDGTDSQKFILQQEQECYAQAVATTGLDTDKVIGTLIETICSSPALSSNPKDYIDEHSIEYRELTYYGRYTLKYCFDRFEKGGETGLDGQIMRRACEDIATGWGEEPLMFSLPAGRVLTGQAWYRAFKTNALSLMEEYSEIGLAERYPASYLLLSMLGGSIDTSKRK
ncbi:MAG: M56 family metallopeptidase [Lachnospiraceae bacterium]|nr:M56 family metallopeptidase [Lachnospiraceae bacterium]